MVTCTMFDAISRLLRLHPIKGEGYWKNKGWYDNPIPRLIFDTAYYISMNVGS